MLTSDFDYNLPRQLIAQIPLEPRDSSRLMVVDKKTKTAAGRYFYNIVDYLEKGDLLVWNNTKVFKARLRGQIVLDKETDGLENKIDTTGKILNAAPVEIFLVKPMENNKVWKVLAKPGKKLRLGMKIVFVPPQEDPASLRGALPEWSAEVMLKENDGTFLVQFADDDMSVRAKANKYGEVPVPPYIGKEPLANSHLQLSERYQTVYAKEEGSVAAPTAGFHFTPELIEKLKTKGVEFAEVTLHVGLGTFLSVKTANVEDHKMHGEWVELTSKNSDLINQAKVEGRRVVAVGTTTARSLEGVARLYGGALKPYAGEINIFIIPGFEFKISYSLITNFHLPKSTLIMLVSAFAGDRRFLLECYEEAVKEKYRFYSFGDAMLIK